MKYIDIIVKKYDQYLLGAIIVLCIFGTVMLFSASTQHSLQETNGLTDTLYLQSHLKRIFIGIIFMFFFMVFDYRKLKDLSYFILGGAVILLILTKGIFLIKGVSSPARWLYVGSLSVQTSDIARMAIIIFLAAYIHDKKELLHNFYEGFLPPIYAIGIVSGLIVIQPDFSTTAMIVLISFGMLFIGGARIPHMLATSTVSLLILTPIMLMQPYRMQRILSYFKPDTVKAENVYQIKQSIISLGNGGFLGLGLGDSLGKNLFLPTPHTDFIFAIIGEETGLLGAIFVLTLFMFIFHRGIQIAKQCSDTFGVMLALGISCSFILYAFINAAVVTNLVPTTGLAMPLISYGGSGLVIHLASLGILLNISMSKRSISGASNWRKRIYG